MKFIVNNGPFIKDKNNHQKIILTNLLLLIPFLIYRCYINGLNSIVLFVISIISSLFSSIMFDYIKNKRLDIKNYYKDVIYSIIVVLITPLNIPYLLLFFVNIIVVLLSKFYNEINIYIITSIIVYIFMIITNNNLIYCNYNIYIYSVLLFVSLITLITNRSIKFRISVAYILFIIIKLIFNQTITQIDYILLFLCLFVIPEFKSTPNTAFIQIIFGIVIGILSMFLNLEFVFISIIILNLVFKYIDKNYAYFLAKNLK